MTTFLALLRGINVGGRNTIPMAELRALCGAAGFRDVQSHIQSGNLVFAGAGTASAVENRLEASIAKRFGFEVEVIVRTAAQWPAYLKGNPFPEASREDPAHVLLALSKSPPMQGAVAALRERATAGERIEASGDALWFHYPAGIGRSKLTPALIDRLVGSTVTARNLRTALKLAEMARAAPATGARQPRGRSRG